MLHNYVLLVMTYNILCILTSCIPRSYIPHQLRLTYYVMLMSLYVIIVLICGTVCVVQRYVPGCPIVNY